MVVAAVNSLIKNTVLKEVAVSGCFLAINISIRLHTLCICMYNSSPKPFLFPPRSQSSVFECFYES